MKTNPAQTSRAPRCAVRTPHSALRTGFTLLELLVVMSIIALLAALSVPVMNNFKPNVTATATRQLFDDLARARQMAISQRTTVYMVFVPGDFWSYISPAQQSVATNLLEKQLTGYALVATRRIGDQPGQRTPRYLVDWRSLPEGTFIAAQKFTNSAPFYVYTNLVAPFLRTPVALNVPFPTETSTNYAPGLPFVAFNYMGQLTDGSSVLNYKESIPIAKGSVAIARDPATKLPTGAQNNPPHTYSVTEAPRGNATDSTYNMVVVDWLTGRAHAERLEVQ